MDPQAIAFLSSDDVLAGEAVSDTSGMAHELRAEPRRVEDGADERVGEERVDELFGLPSKRPL